MGEKILVIDDEPLNLKMAEFILKKEYTVLCAKSGAEGVALIVREKPDLVILDLLMPDMDGMEVLAQIRQNPDIADTKVVFLTASNAQADAARAAKLGALDFIRKPFTGAEFAARIRHALQTPQRDEIVVVDDDRMGLLLAKRLLSDEYDVSSFPSGAQALEHLQISVPSLLLLDLHMPDMDGLEILRRLRANPNTAHLPVIFLTADDDRETEAAILRAGASDFIQKPFVAEVALCRIRRTIELYHYEQSLHREVNSKASELQATNRRLENLSEQIMMALADAIDAKDAYTNGHSLRVAFYSRELARRLGKSEQEVHDIYYIGLLHDIGKIGIPNAIINKPGKLTDEEYAVIKQHPAIGAKILENITELPNLSVGAHWHHEWYNGGGYPDGLKGEEIPEVARIVGVADAYDTMSSKRSYRDVLPQDVVRREIERCSGTQFDPAIAAVMLQMIDEDTAYDMRER